VRGEKIEILDPTGAKLVGQIVSIEPGLPASDKTPSEGEQLNLFTADGLQSVPLRKLKKIHFLKAELEAEFRQALEVLAAARGSAKKTVTLNFTGAGTRKVKVGYVTEAPMWKASYRLRLGEKPTANLQGWAAIENTTEEDWKNVRIGLVSGRPMAFQMDLYQPLFVPRPTVEPELYASLRPPVYAGQVLSQTNGNFGNIVNQGMQNSQVMLQNSINPGAINRYSSTREMLGNRLNYEDLNKRLAETQSAFGRKPTSGGVIVGGVKSEILSGAAAVSLGEIFEYTIPDPLTLPRLKSALLPILSSTIDTSRVSIYNESTLAKHPLLGLKLVNKTPHHLSQGPITVYEGEAFAGD
ncbi:MAG: DUF4139 domain-containing protein, partial [Gemmataceae bacterium]